MQNSITLDEFTDIFKYLLANNKRLVDKGKHPYAISVTGAPGIGKTAIVEALAESLGMSFVRINMAELDEISDLVGYPIKEYETKEGNWISADLLSNHCDSEFTGRTRMGYATPEWLPREYNPNGTILFADDYNRATSIFMNACMTLIQKGTYVSWSLPKYTTIVLSNNPDDGSMQVSSFDSAQASRMINFPVRFTIENWARWAESDDMDNRGINFALNFSHELFENENAKAHINARSYTMFIDSISGIDNWNDPASLAMILNISKGCFEDPDNIVGSLFTTFIANKLDQLVAPKDMLLEDWSTVEPKIKKCVYDGSTYRPSVASVLHTRLLNYADVYLKEKGKMDTVVDRLLEIMHSKDKLFDEDIIFNIIKTLHIKYPGKAAKMFMNPEIRKKVL